MKNLTYLNINFHLGNIQNYHDMGTCTPYSGQYIGLNWNIQGELVSGKSTQWSNFDSNSDHWFHYWQSQYTWLLHSIDHCFCLRFCQSTQTRKEKENVTSLNSISTGFDK